MTKKEKMALNKELGQIWMQYRSLKNAVKKDPTLSPGWKNIKAKHEAFIDNNQELSAAILLAYPNLFEQIKTLLYPHNIDKTVACLNAIIPSDDAK